METVGAAHLPFPKYKNTLGSLIQYLDTEGSACCMTFSVKFSCNICVTNG